LKGDTLPHFQLTAENRGVIELLLREKRELRRELVSFMCSLGDVWKNLPADMDALTKAQFLRALVDKHATEIEYGLSRLDEQIQAFLREIAGQWRQEVESRCAREIGIIKASLQEAGRKISEEQNRHEMQVAKMQEAQRKSRQERLAALGTCAEKVGQAKDVLKRMVVPAVAIGGNVESSKIELQTLLGELTSALDKVR
jgi:hypothetical protein